MGGTTASAEQRRDALLRRQAAAHDRVLKDASLKTLCGALARISRKCAESMSSSVGQGVRIHVRRVHRGADRRFEARIRASSSVCWTTLSQLSTKNRASPRKVFGTRDDECMKVQFATLRKALFWRGGGALIQIPSPSMRRLRP